MENEELNKKITEWLGLCWHEFTEADERDPVISYCSKCHKPDYEYDLDFKIWEPVNQNIEFTASLDVCFKEIVPKLLENKWKVRIAWSGIPPGKPQANLSNWDSQFIRQTRPQISVYAETPALALCLATEKLIDRESPKR